MSRVGSGLALVAGVTVLALGWLHPSPLAFDLGPGDDAFFEYPDGRWRAFERRGPVEFRSTGSGLSFGAPLGLVGQHVLVDLRLARFAERPALVTVFLGSRSIGQWVQRPGGWRVRTLDAGVVDGRVSLAIRVAGEDAMDPGLALDWVRLREAEALRPVGWGWVGLALLLLGPAVALAYATGRLSTGALCTGLCSALLGVALMHDAGGTLAVTRVIVGRGAFAWALLGAAGAVGWRASATWRALPRVCIVVPPVFALVVLVGLSSPRFHHPDVETHSRFLSAIRQRPEMALNPLGFQREARTWTRFIDGEWRGLPYSPAFHLLALAPSLGLGETGALKVLAAVVVACGLWVVAFAAVRLGGSARTALSAQLVFALLPVTASRLSLALWPALLGQLLEIVLVLTLLWFRETSLGNRSLAACWGTMVVTMISYTGCIVSVGCLSAVFACWLGVTGDRKRAVTLLGLYGVAFVAVVVGQYHYYLPVLWRDILPALGKTTASGGTWDWAGRFLYRLWLFYGYYCIAAALGCGWLLRGHPSRRAVQVWLIAGLVLGVLRAGAPVLLGDLKEVELLAAPVALCVGLGFGDVGRRRGLCLAFAFWVLLGWSAFRSLARYSERLSLPAWSETSEVQTTRG
jgi:hypothetical protein